MRLFGTRPERSSMNDQTDAAMVDVTAKAARAETRAARLIAAHRQAIRDDAVAADRRLRVR